LRKYRKREGRIKKYKETEGKTCSHKNKYTCTMYIVHTYIVLRSSLESSRISFRSINVYYISNCFKLLPQSKEGKSRDRVIARIFLPSQLERTSQLGW
jgi:hypothetical protein